MSSISHSHAEHKSSAPRKTFEERQAEKLAARELAWASKSPAEKAAYFAKVDARAAESNARIVAERDAIYAEEAKKVNALEWASDTLADHHACPRLRSVAIALLNDDNLLGVRFVPPVMTAEETAGRDHRVAVAAVERGAASVRPTVAGYGLIEGLSDGETLAVLSAVSDARDAEKIRLFGSASADAIGDTRVDRVGERVGKVALAAVLRLRTPATDHDPDRPSDSWPADSDTAFWTAREVYDDACEAEDKVAKDETDALFMTCASDVGHIPTSVEYDAWLADFNRDTPYSDEPPALTEADYFDPEEDDADWFNERIALASAIRGDASQAELVADLAAMWERLADGDEAL